MRFVKYGSIVLISTVIVAGIAIPTVSAPQNWLEFPTIPGLGQKSRNIFFHVPMAWVAVLAYLVSMYYGLQYLRTRHLENDTKSVSAAGLGTLFCVLATVTGAIWAKFNWGDYWNWDPRETSIFILLLIYGAYFALRSSLGSEEIRARLSAVYSLVAGITVPFFIFVMPRMMVGLHPGAKGDPEGKGPVLEFKMAPNMRIVFFLALIGFTLLFFWLLDLRVRTAKLEHDQSHKQRG